ncbi:hypothetical protein A9K55_002373 [Cordyceps militaris]|uniref:Aminoglycoside phosphotransferase domain-containing protein n=1 Tax=Cordyceps militaris TaxID=73501 RepID=A0A2H4S6B3_CORMI|nr:hypothetical protein A9K55_002373 [Cordyceps militaris]
MEASIASLSKYQISQFFARHTPCTQAECNATAELIAGTSVNPTAVQGGGSYTVIGGKVIVQFRAGDSALDLELLQCVGQAYPGFTPVPSSRGKLGKLDIYTMDDVGGISMYLARVDLQKDDCKLLHQTVQDYARFFASAWLNRPMSLTCPNPGDLFASYSSQLSQLSAGMPQRYRSTLDGLLAQLPQLFDGAWTMVPNHTDLLENNIHVDPVTGKLKGICDWRDVEISPFGMSLGGLETMLGVGIMKPNGTTGWRYHANQQALRKLFWDVFYCTTGLVSQEQKNRIEVARLVGLFLSNGFTSDGRGSMVPAGEGSHGVGFLDAVLNLV